VTSTGREPANTAAGSDSETWRPDPPGIGATGRFGATTWVLEGRRHVVVSTTASLDGTVGGRQVIGHPLADTFPELIEQQLISELDEVLRTGRTISVSERSLLIDVTRSGRLSEGFITVTLSAWRRPGTAGGVIATVLDVTEAVLARRGGPSEQNPDEPGRAAVARDMQQALLPAALPSVPGARLSARYLAGPDQAVGGDWYDVTVLADGRLCAVVGDVVGHGVEATAVMGQLRAALTALAAEESDPGALLARLDRFASRLPGARGTTVCVAFLDLAGGDLCYASAGHPPPLLVGTDGRARYLDGAAGTPLATTAVDGYLSATAMLDPGATLVCYSDGAVERRGQPLQVGQLRLAARAAECAGDDPDTMSDHLSTELFRVSAAEDDAVLLVLDRGGPAANPLRIAVPARPGQLPLMRRAVQQWMRRVGVPEDDALAMVMAFGEAAANAVEHAYGGAEGPPADVVVAAALDDTGMLTVEVRDRGRWLTPSTAPGSRGRGMFLMRESVDAVEVERTDKGTAVVLRKAARRPASPRLADLAAVPVRNWLAEDDVGPTVSADAVGGRVIARVVGEIDDSNAGLFWSRLLEAHRGGALPLTVDLSEVGYLASAGIRVIFDLAAVATEAGQRLRLVVPRTAVTRRILELCAVQQVADFEPDMVPGI
jgi:anti-anti-sigma factor